MTLLDRASCLLQLAARFGGAELAEAGVLDGALVEFAEALYFVPQRFEHLFDAGQSFFVLVPFQRQCTSSVGANRLRKQVGFVRGLTLGLPDLPHITVVNSSNGAQ